jgi:hypothetical protein
MSVAVDFGITQIVDVNYGVHAVIRKNIFKKTNHFTRYKNNSVRRSRHSKRVV